MVNYEEAYLLMAAAGRDFESSGSCDIMRPGEAKNSWTPLFRNGLRSRASCDDDLGVARIFLENAFDQR